jgi:hypothetical protein
MTTTLCNSGAVVLKAGANAAVLTDARYTQLINQAEDFVVCSTRNDYITSYSGLSANKKLILEDVTSCIAAIYVISYDMSGFTSRQEALIMVNILWARIAECMRLLNNDNTRGFIG